MPNPPTRQIFLPNYKLNVTVPADYSDDQIADAIQRNKTQIQQASPVYAQGQKYLQKGLGPDDAGNGLKVPGLGITEQQARTQGIGPAVQAAQDATQYNSADQLALLRHYAAVRAINSANQHRNAAQIIAQAQANLLPTDRLTAIGDRATRAVNDVVNTPLLNHVLDYGAPGASQQLEQMQGYGAGLARGVLGFSSPGSLGAMAVLGPLGAEPMGAKMLLGAFGAPAVAGAYQRAQSGDVGGALGELTAFGLPFALHLGRLAQEAKNAADYRAGARWMDANYGVDVEPPAPPQLPSGSAPNVYEADFRPDRPTTPAPADLALKLDRPAHVLQIASAPLAEGGFGVNQAGNGTWQVPGLAVPLSYGHEMIHFPADLGASRSPFLDESAPSPAGQDGGLVRYRPSVPAPLDRAVPLPSVTEEMESPALSSALPSIVSPSNPPSVPLTVTSGEAQALSTLLGEQHPFTTAMEQLFADGRTNAEVPVTLPQLTVLRDLTAQTTSLPESGPGPYSRPSPLKPINAVPQSFLKTLDAGALLPQISQAITGIGQQLNTTTTPPGMVTSQSGSFKPTERKRTRFDGLQMQGDKIASLAKLGDMMGAAVDIAGLKLGPLRNIGSVDTGHSVGVRLGNGRMPIKNIKNEIANKVADSGIVSAHQMEREMHSEVVSQYPDEPEKNEPTDFGRIEVKGTEAEGHLSAEWYDRFIDHARNGSLCKEVLLQDLLQGETLKRAQHAFKKNPAVLQSPVVIADDLADTTVGTIAKHVNSPSGRAIALNGRFWVDPEDIIFVIAEEAMHIAHRLGKRPIDPNPIYRHRRHEITAKKGASYVSGRPDVRYVMIIIR